MMTPTDGVWRDAGRDVHWGLGIPVCSSNAERSHIGRLWVEDLVRERELFAWEGVDDASSGIKPRFSGHPDADFSISHSGSIVLVAVASGSGVGADVEAAPFRAFESDALRRRMCFTAEAEQAASMTAAARMRYLAQLWTAREAAVKASGRGLAHDFRTFEFDLGDPGSSLSAVGHLAITYESGAAVARIESRADGGVTILPDPAVSRPIPTLHHALRGIS